MTDDWNIKDTLIPGNGKYGGKAWYDEVDIETLRKKVIEAVGKTFGYHSEYPDVIYEINKLFGVEEDD